MAKSTGEQTRQRLFDAAIEMMQAEGFDRTTVDSIAARAGVAKGTFYVHFKGKVELLEALLENNLIIPEVAGRLSASAVPLSYADLHDIVAVIWKAFESRREILKIILRSGLVAGFKADRMLATIDSFSEQAGVALLPQTADATAAVRASVAMILGIYIEEKITRTQPTLNDEAWIKVLTDILYHGLVSTHD